MRILYWAVPVILMSACSQEVPTETPEVSVAEVEIPALEMQRSDSYESAHTAAVAAIEKASAKGHAWVTSDQLIEAAAAAAADGDDASAIELADEARWQAQLAIMQADREAAHWRANALSD